MAADVEAVSTPQSIGSVLPKASLAFAVVKYMTCQCQRPTLNPWGDTVPLGDQPATTWYKLITQNRPTLEGATTHLLFQHTSAFPTFTVSASASTTNQGTSTTDPRTPTTRPQRKDLLHGKGALAVSTQSERTSPPT